MGVFSLKKDSCLFDTFNYLFVFLAFLYGSLDLTLIVVLIKNIIEVSSFFIILNFIFLLGFSVVIFLYFKKVYMPYKKAVKTIEQFNSGLTLEGLFNLKIFIFKGMEPMLNRIEKLLNRNYEIAMSKKQAEYLALQNQINPHFLYNTLEAIRGDALSEGMDRIADMVEALATFYRYTISKLENLVDLEDEITNVENYFIIQKYRFGDKLNLEFCYEDVDDTIFEYKLPKLTLQPIVENAIYHGLECKVGKGLVRISFYTTKSRLIIHIKDDGIGIEEDSLEKIISKLNIPSFDYTKDDKEKGGIALINVNNRIKLLFGEQYGINISSAIDYGTDVEITLPISK